MSEYDLTKNIESIITKQFPDGTNIQFVIKDYNGKVLYSTYTKGRPQIAAIYLESYDDYGFSYYNYGYETVYDENGNVIHDFGEMLMYVSDLENTDVEDSIYGLYLDFYKGNAERYSVLTSMAVSVIGMLILLCWVMASAGYSRKEGPAKLRFYDKIPLEIFLAIYAGLVVLFSALIIWVGEEYDALENYINNIIIPAIIIAAPLVLCFFASIANRIKTNTFFKNTVIWWGLKLIWKILKWCLNKAAVIFKFT